MNSVVFFPQLATHTLAQISQKNKKTKNEYKKTR
jgi:hypothetical protein